MYWLYSKSNCNVSTSNCNLCLQSLYGNAQNCPSETGKHQIVFRNTCMDYSTDFAELYSKLHIMIMCDCEVRLSEVFPSFEVKTLWLPTFKCIHSNYNSPIVCGIWSNHRRNQIGHNLTTEQNEITELSPNVNARTIVNLPSYTIDTLR